MKVDFNNLRKQALYSYHRLCTLLNTHIDKESGDIIIDPNTIQEEMDDLRTQLVCIGACYNENDDDCKSIISEVGEIASFYQAE